MAFNNCSQCSQWCSFPVSVGGREMRDSVAAPCFWFCLTFWPTRWHQWERERRPGCSHSDTSAACHREPSHTVPTLQQRVGPGSHSPHAAWQRWIHLSAVWSRDFTMKKALWARTEISHTLNSHHQQSSHSEKGQGGADKQGQRREEKLTIGSFCLGDWLATT